MRTVGIKLADGSFYPVMEEGSAQKKTLELTTAHNNQKCVMVDLYRSKTCSMEDAEYIDTLKIDNLVEHPNGEPSISFDVGLDENGELSASIADPETGATSNSEITLVSRTVEERLQADDYSIEEPAVDAEEAPQESEKTGNGAAVAAGVVAGAGLMAAAAALAANKDDEEPAVEETMVEEPAEEEPFAEETITEEPVAEETLGDENALTEEPVAEDSIPDENSFQDSDFDLPDMDDTTFAEDTPLTTEEPAAENETFADDTELPEDTTFADDTALPEDTTFAEDTPLTTEEPTEEHETFAEDTELPEDTTFADDTIAEEDPTQTEDFSVPDGLTDNSDFSEASGFAETTAKDPLFNDDMDMTTIDDTPAETFDEAPAQDFADSPTEVFDEAPDQTFEDTPAPAEDFDTSLPDDFDSSSTEGLDDTTVDNFDDDFNTEPVPAANESLNFSGLYDKETEMGNSSDNQDDDIKKKTRAPVIICIICAIICLVATALVLLVLPTKFNLRLKHSQKKQETSIEKPAEQAPAPAAEQQEKKPEPVPQAKEDEVVVIEKAEEVKPLPPPAPETKPAGVTYKIKWGDTLWDLADTYYKNPWRYKKIAKYNNIKNPDYIISGTVITIPAE